jgi:CRISPR-associated protein Csa1
MHFIAIQYSKTPNIVSVPCDITLRGNDPRTWIAPELYDVQLPVNAIAYAYCPTFRDIYLEVIEGKQRLPTWGRYQGKVIDEVYKSIHRVCEQYTSSCETKSCDLYAHLISQQDTIVEQAKRKYKTDFEAISLKPLETEVQQFDTALRKIVKFEAEITSSIIDFEIARLESANPRKIFQDSFDFNTDFALTTKHHGFGTPSIPDFIFRNTIIGDIKTGPWQDFFLNTVIAYALAYEEHSGIPMNFGAILHVELPQSRLVPTHYRVTIEKLDDYHRKRFLAIRDRKLQIIKDKIDPGKPEDKTKCKGCSFEETCWGTTT